jgi:hypothetical protein
VAWMSARIELPLSVHRWTSPQPMRLDHSTGCCWRCGGVGCTPTLCSEFQPTSSNASARPAAAAATATTIHILVHCCHWPLSAATDATAIAPQCLLLHGQQAPLRHMRCCALSVPAAMRQIRARSSGPANTGLRALHCALHRTLHRRRSVHATRTPHCCPPHSSRMHSNAWRSIMLCLGPLLGPSPYALHAAPPSLSPPLACMSCPSRDQPCSLRAHLAHVPAVQHFPVGICQQPQALLAELHSHHLRPHRTHKLAHLRHAFKLVNEPGASSNRKKARHAVGLHSGLHCE